MNRSMFPETGIYFALLRHDGMTHTARLPYPR